MSNETKKTEQLIQIYKDDPVADNLQALIHQANRTTFLIPAMMPKDVDREEIKQLILESGGQPSKLPDGARPMPCVLTNDEGKMYFPVYTSQEQIPKEPKYDVIMNMSFQGCCTMVMHESIEAGGLVFNPFTDNLIFKKKLIELIRKEYEMSKSGGARQVTLTPQQFKLMMRQKAEFHDFPSLVYQEGAEFIQNLSEEKETVVNEIYRKAYQKPELYPYGEGSFSVMPLNISEELLLIRVDLPEEKGEGVTCCRIYVTLNPKNDEIHYFTIEKGKEKGERNLGGIDSEGKHTVYGEAPVEGAELQRIMDLLKEQGQTSA